MDTLIGTNTFDELKLIYDLSLSVYQIKKNRDAMNYGTTKIYKEKSLPDQPHCTSI